MVVTMVSLMMMLPMVLLPMLMVVVLPLFSIDGGFPSRKVDRGPFYNTGDTETIGMKSCPSSAYRCGGLWWCNAFEIAT